MKIRNPKSEIHNSSRTLVFGDIHGCDVALDVLLTQLAPTADDTVVLLGDVIDRGPGTKAVLDQLLQLRDTCRLVFVMGNHEEMLLKTLDGESQIRDAWLVFGGQQTLDSYGGEMQDIPDEHREFLASALPLWETDSDIFVHAGLNPDVELSEQTPDVLRWNKLTGSERPHPSGKRIICGHTPITTGRPAVFDGWVCIDTWAYQGLFLTCLNVSTNQVYQAQQTGRYRDGVSLDAVNLL